MKQYIAKLSEKEKKIFYIAIVLVSLALLDRLFLGPVLDKLNDIKKEVETQKSVIQRDARFLQYKDKIIKENEVFDSYFIDEIEDEDVISADFLSTVEKLATNLNINLARSNPTKTEARKRYIEYYAELDCSGNLENIISFMHAINSTSEMLKVVKFNMTEKRGFPDEVNVSMTIVKLIIGHGMSNTSSTP
ncbi:MAG: hypothetical protein P9X22_08715 [Candidatus Zapsychrus exili]|nr:hypothetical protein [Candidatus Zapsychrus exili]